MMDLNAWLLFSPLTKQGNGPYAKEFLAKGAPFLGNRVNFDRGFNEDFLAQRGILRKDTEKLTNEYKHMIGEAGGRWVPNDDFKPFMKHEKRGWHVADDIEILAKMLNLRCPKMGRVWRPLDLTDGEMNAVEKILGEFFKSKEKSRSVRQVRARVIDKDKQASKLTKGMPSRQLAKLQLGGKIFKK
jgi:hypothetical protein